LDPQRFYIKTMGCKVNSFDGHAMGNRLKALGFEQSETPADADIAIVNTCSVTANADREARYLARKFKRENPNSVVVMAGCYAQTDSKKLESLDDVDLIVPNEVKEQFADFIVDQLGRKSRGQPMLRSPEGVKLVENNRQSHFKSSLTLFDKADSTQTRAFVKIQDGCNGFCSYCLIPYARGASRSVQTDAALAEIKRLVQSGHREIVLTGIHIGDYGLDLDQYARAKEEPFVTFVRNVFAIPGLQRLRISSLEPAELTPALMNVLKDHEDQFCAHFHLPLQSGDDDILKKMNRKYDTARYLESCIMAREAFPQVCLGADVIPGFPSETEEQHQNTLAFIRKAGLHYLHVFPYSKRPNTAAAKMPHHLDGAIISARAKELRTLSDQLKLSYYRKFIGQLVDVLWENDFDSSARLKGITGNYLPVVSSQSTRENPVFSPGSIHPVKLAGLTSEGQILGAAIGSETRL
jgi:threonylcarbamoyladenosine tRNA methylthiotransferase MtaB